MIVVSSNSVIVSTVVSPIKTSMTPSLSVSFNVIVTVVLSPLATLVACTSISKSRLFNVNVPVASTSSNSSLPVYLTVTVFSPML